MDKTFFTQPDLHSL